MKIFEKIQYIDGGPNDRGEVIGYIKAHSLQEAKKILNVNHGFIQVYEISKIEFEARKNKAWLKYKMYKID